MLGPWGYPKVVETVLGLFGLVIFIVGVISLAAGMTWAVVKITPAEKRPKKTGEASPSA
jgi:hypothetical protein